MGFIYHGTSALSLDRIRKDGLCGKPRGSKVHWSFHGLISFTPKIWYANHYASGLQKDWSIKSDEEVMKRFPNYENIPGLIIRVRKEDMLKYCKELPTSVPEHIEIKCRKNCIKVPMNACIIDSKTRKKADNLGWRQNEHDKSDELLLKYCNDKWKQIIFF